MELDIIEYYTLLRDAVIYNNSQSKSGIEWLDNAWILEQKNPDRAAIRRYNQSHGKERSNGK